MTAVKRPVPQALNTMEQIALQKRILPLRFNASLAVTLVSASLQRLSRCDARFRFASSRSRAVAL